MFSLINHYLLVSTTAQAVFARGIAAVREKYICVGECSLITVQAVSGLFLSLLGGSGLGYFG